MRWVQSQSIPDIENILIRPCAELVAHLSSPLFISLTSDALRLSIPSRLAMLSIFRVDTPFSQHSCTTCIKATDPIAAPVAGAGL